MTQELEGHMLATNISRDETVISTAGGNISLAHESVLLSPDTNSALMDLCQRASVPLSALFFTAYNVLFYRYCANEEIVIGVLESNKNGSNQQIVLHGNRISGEIAASSLYALYHSHEKSNVTHENSPFTAMRNAGEIIGAYCMPIAGLAKMGFPGTKSAWTDLLCDRCSFDLLLQVVRLDGAVSVRLNYQFEIFDQSAMSRLLRHYINLVQGIASNEHTAIAKLPMLSATERRHLLVELNDTKRHYPDEKCLHQLFEEQVLRTPASTAVVFGDKQYSYSQLNRRANQIAHHLRKIGVRPDTPVGISMDRSFELVAGIFGILKAGGAYVPLDPNYPKPHLKYMLEYSRIQILLTEKCLAGHMGDVTEHVRYLDDLPPEVLSESTENPEQMTHPNNLIYIIFTSGSTGKPKGVGVYHRGFGNLINWFTEEFHLRDNERVLVVSSLSFDLTQKNYFAPLITGGTLYLLPSGHFDPQRIASMISEHKITLLNCTPSTFYPLVESSDSLRFDKLGSLRHLFLGGEPISHSRLRPWVDSPSYHAEIVNTYGPTECSDICAFHRLAKFDWSSKATVPIGKPIHNTSLVVLSEHGEICPAGVLGELCVAGEGVGAGYINDPELTSRKFIPVPLSELPGKWLYKTGDLVRMRSDENFEFLGRIDHQVKIRGFRIELGEIEAVLEGHPAIRQAVVVATDASSVIIQDAESAAPGDAKQLAAYVVPKPSQTPAPADLRQYLKERLPEYMVPAVLLVLEQFPLSPNGKVDKRALPAPKGARQDEVEVQILAPEKNMERALVEIWKDVLHLEKVGMDENFFDIGGDSLLIIEVHTRVEEKYKLGSSVTTFFECPTIEMLARKLNGEQASPLSSVQDRARRQRQAMGLS